MPVGGLAAIIGPVLPAGGPFHHFEGLIYGIAVLWFVAALLGAHLRGSDERRGTNGPGT